ncbi:MAG: hypothetical protein C6P35_14530 [Cohnella sp.]|uniref:immunoglobulin-like domain-containing protein n=1 Tax=Cohnella sp. TaxID=1883426 RepID=UPI000E379C14|nr:MAG: hypothetical protein C6P35_14530 [Cohnella sp.]
MQPFAGHGIGVSVSAGAKKPGDRVDASIHVIEPAKARDILTRTIRCKLTERKRDGAYLRTVAESTERLTDLNSYSGFSAQLPEKEGAWYYLTAEILSGEQVEDTALGALEVPVQEVKAELTLDRPAYPGSGDIVVTLRNNEPTTLFYGLDYRLEHRDGDIWTPVPMEENAAVPAIGIELKAGGAWKQKIRVTDLPSGEYRIAKDVEGKGTSIRKTLTAGFRVEPQETAK